MTRGAVDEPSDAYEMQINIETKFEQEFNSMIEGAVCQQPD